MGWFLKNVLPQEATVTTTTRRQDSVLTAVSS
jgi:hypothetical protein